MASEAAEHLAAQVLKACGVAPEPPVPIEQVARALGVDGIKRGAMIEDGRLERQGGRTTIFLRHGVGAARQRFTIGHELGHLLLAGAEREVIARRVWAPPDREERFCDEFAAALLLPREWLVGEFKGVPERLAQARGLAERSGASLSASVVRLREVLGWRSSLLHWRRHEGEWGLRLSAGLPTPIHNRVGSELQTRAVLDELAKLGGDQRQVLPIAIGGRPHRVPAEISAGRESALALADFSRAVPLTVGEPNPT